MASSSTGRVPQGEVVMEFGDGGTYIKHRLEAAVLNIEKRKIQKEEGLKAQRAMEALEVSQSGPKVRSEDVDLLVAQMACTRAVAEEALKESKGDLIQAILKMVKPPPRARSVDGGGEVRT